METISPLPTTAKNITTLLPNPAEISLTRSTVIAFCGLTVFILFLACCIVFIYYCGTSSYRSLEASLDARTSAVLLFLAALVATIAGVSGTTSALDIYRIYIFAIGLMVGLCFTFIGAFMFFDSKPTIFDLEGKVKSKSIGHKHGNMGIVIWLVTLPLITMEFAILLGNLRRPQSTFYIGDYIVALLQKLSQATIYYFSVRHRYPCSRLPFASQWYFAVLSLFNFIMWEDSILTSHMDDEYSRELYGNGFTIFKATYNSLLIDYRLMCCLLFVEHAVEISEQTKDLKQGNSDDPAIQPSRDPSAEHQTNNCESDENEHEAGFLEAGTPEIRIPKAGIPESGQFVHLTRTVGAQASHYTGAGYIVGLICFALQAVNGLQYLGFVGPWSSIMAMSAHVLMFVFGMVFLKVNNLDAKFGRWKESESRSIDAMVGIMGGVGFAFMILRALITSHLASYYQETSLTSYLSMTAGKNCLNAFGLLFQFYMFMRVSFNACSRNQNENLQLNHFLVPALIMIQLAIFVTAVIDQYDGLVENLLSRANLGPATLFFLGVGAPIYLGFCLHMFLHFLIVRRDMTTKKVRIAYILEDTSHRQDYPPQFGLGTEHTEEHQSELERPLI